MRLTLPIQRTAVLLLALAWVLPVVAPLTHSEDHGHRFCVEHQTFEEAPAVGTVPAKLADPRASITSAAAALEAALFAHTPCPVTSAATRDALANAQRHGSLVCAALSASAVAFTSLAHAPLEVLAVAPKASPPVSRG